MLNSLVNSNLATASMTITFSSTEEYSVLNIRLMSSVAWPPM
jgi:hypothetical protein